MPNCFTLTRKSDLKAGPVAFTVIDEELCAHLGIEVDPVSWCFGWYNIVGFALALGKSFTEIREYCEDYEDLHPIIDYLEANFISDTWAEIGRR